MERSDRSPNTGAEPRQDPPEESAEETPSNLDLVSIGLAVFFVSLIVIVGALLILPNLF